MDNYLFNQLEFIRNNTLSAVENSTDEMANNIPEGFRNNIRWHLGHIYYTLECFAFDPINLPMILPNDFKIFFANGTSPLNWNSTTPSLEEIISLLREQPVRIRSELNYRLLDKVDKPFIHPTGRITLETVGGFLSFNLYHEGMHLNSIKNYKSLYNK
ncbi:DinB family protein [Bacillaceae bacterium IKA-2]|nr:DinB family protein [Bacillaceae bacterium IKA-2]